MVSPWGPWKNDSFSLFFLWLLASALFFCFTLHFCPLSQETPLTEKLFQQGVDYCKSVNKPGRIYNKCVYAHSWYILQKKISFLTSLLYNLMQELFLHEGIESQVLFFFVIHKKQKALQCNWSWWNRAQLIAITQSINTSLWTSLNFV